jgi:CBS domain-containing protein
MQVRDVMTAQATIVHKDDTIASAAQLMAEEDVGALPVREGDSLVGVITDRDIATRAIAKERGPSTAVEEIMTASVLYCFEDQECDEIAQNMAENKVRRLPVMNRDKRLIGMVAIADLARMTSEESAKHAVQGVSQPTEGAAAF